MIKVDSKNVAKYSRHFRALIADRSTTYHVESASTWYVEGERLALDIANIMGTSLEVGACVISAFSPRERWSSNVVKAYKLHTDSPNKTQYAEISRAVTNVAVSMGISPRTCQALIWILIRGGAE